MQPRGDRYFTGRPCKRGHIAERSVANRGCLECHREDAEKRRIVSPDHVRRIEKESRDRNPMESLRHRKSEMPGEAWKRSLLYFQVKNQERRNAPGKLSADIRTVLFTKQGGVCNGCGARLSDAVHLDHIHPISRGGVNEDYNVQLLCANCNLSKGNKTMEEWING